MFARSAQYAAVLLLIAVVTSGVGRGAITYDFDGVGVFDEDGNSEPTGLDGHEANDTAFFDDDATGAPNRKLTTTSVRSLGGTTDSNLNESSGFLGVGDNTFFESNEAWKFHWDVSTRLSSISFASSSASVTFGVRTEAWGSRSFDTDSDGNLDFDSGEFTFSLAANTSRTFNLDQVEQDSGDTLRVDQDEVYTFRSPAGEQISLTSFTFQTTAVPEPGSAIALLGIAGLAVGRRFHRKRKQAVASSEK